MYYQGENIQINITSDSVTDLANKDFKLLVYPHYERTNSNFLVTIEKKDFSQYKQQDGKTVFSVSISHSQTKELPTGDYDIEILILENNVFRSIFKKDFAFTLGFANSKTIE